MWGCNSKGRDWNHFRESLWSLVSLSIRQTSASLTAKDSLKAITSAWITFLDGMLYSNGVWLLSLTSLPGGFHTRADLSKRTLVLSPIPFVACKESFNEAQAVPWYLTGRGSNDSKSDCWCFVFFPYTFLKLSFRDHHGVLLALTWLFPCTDKANHAITYTNLISRPSEVPQTWRHVFCISLHLNGKGLLHSAALRAIISGHTRAINPKYHSKPCYYIY